MSGHSTYESLLARIEALEAEEARLLEEVRVISLERDQFRTQAEHGRQSWCQGASEEAACIEGEVRYRAQRRRDAAAKRPASAETLNVMAYECDKIASMIAGRRGSK